MTGISLGTSRWRRRRVRAFIEFATALFERIEQLRSNRLAATASPDWILARRSMASRAG